MFRSIQSIVGFRHSALMRGGLGTGMVAMNMPAAAQRALDEANARMRATQAASGELSLAEARARVREIMREP